MSSIMRARSALTGRGEGWEVIGGSSLELKVAGPSMLGIGCSGRHALPLTPPQKAPTVTRAPIPRERVRSWGKSRRKTRSSALHQIADIRASRLSPNFLAPPDQELTTSHKLWSKL